MHRYRGDAHPNAVLGSALSIILDYRVPVFFCSNRQAACQFVQAYLLGRTREVECMTKTAAAEADVLSAASWRRSSTRGPTFSAGRLRTADGSAREFRRQGVRQAERRRSGWKASGPTIRNTAASSRPSVIGLRPGNGSGWAGELPGQPSRREGHRPGEGPPHRRSSSALVSMPRSGAGPKQLLRSRRCRSRSTLALQRIWVANSDFNAAMTYLSRFGLTHHQVTTLVEQVRQPGGADPGTRSVRADARDPRLRVQTRRQDRPQDGHAQGSAVADSRRNSVLRARGAG